MAVDQEKRARRICLSFPETTEKEAWGTPTFRVKGKLFAMFADNHHNDGRVALWLAADFGMQEELIARKPKNYFVPPYVGCNGWIGVHLDKNDDKTVRQRVIEAYDLTLEKAQAKRKQKRR
jgi:hypothetical protein